MIPDLVIFDCDGVLVDSEPISNRALVANLSRHGLSLSVDAAMNHFIGGSMDTVARKARDLGATLPDGWIEDMYGDMYAALRQGVEPIPGVIAVLDRLDRVGLPYCVASNGSDEKMDITFGATGLMDRFAGKRFSAHALGVSKPDPELFLIAARHFGVDPARAVVIEDSLSGALAAQRAGMPCFGYAPEGHGATLADVGARIFTDMADLPGLLRLPD